MAARQYDFGETAVPAHGVCSTMFVVGRRYWEFGG